MKDYDVSSKLFVIPQYEDNKEFLLAVDRRTKALVRQRFSFFAEYDWECNTIATVTLKNLISVLYLSITGATTDVLGIISEDEDHTTFLDFLGLLTIQPTMRRNEKAEKNGSINCKFTPGKRIDAIIADDDETREGETKKYKIDEYYLTGNEKLDLAWDKFDTLVRRELSEKYKIILQYHYSTIGFTECFLESLYREMLIRMNTTDEIAVSTNVNDYFEMSAICINNPDASVGVKFTMTPGRYGKLTIKSDLTTESEED